MHRVGRRKHLFHVIALTHSNARESKFRRPGMMRASTIEPLHSPLTSTCLYAAFSMPLHRVHSKVRTAPPSCPHTKPVNVIGPWHFGHGGRSIPTRPRSVMRDCGMCCSHKIKRERDALCHTE